MKLPEIKKEVKDFLSEESGIISKENIIKTGIVVGSILAATKNIFAADNTVYHANNIDIKNIAGEVNASHSHHASHANFT